MDECFFGHKDALLLSFILLFVFLLTPKIASVVGKFHDLKGNYAQDNPERGFCGRAHNIEGKWSESVIKLFDFAHSTDVH